MDKTIKTEIALGIIVIVAVIIGGFLWLGNRQPDRVTNSCSTPPRTCADGTRINLGFPDCDQRCPEERKMCTQEAKLCPDGQTYVSRTGPNCEFAQCPAQSVGETANWQMYSNGNLGVSFKYPNGWYVKEEKMIGSGSRIYVRNTAQKDVNKGNMPSDFQQVWISTWEQEVNLEQENNIKNKRPEEISGSMSVSIVSSDGIVMNTYEYGTSGGPILQAFWSDKNGKRYYAASSSEVGRVNQQNMIVNLKKILSTFKFTK